MWLGHLEKEINRWGHTWVIRTLKGSEELQASLLAKEYQDTFGQVKAWAWAQLAHAIVSVDGDENWCPPIGPDPMSNSRAKFRYMTENWYWPIGDYLFGQYAILVQSQDDAMREVQNLSERSLPSSMPSVDFSTEAGDLLDET